MISFLKSVFLGREGNYKVLGQNVEFTNKNLSADPDSTYDIFKNKAFTCSSLMYAKTLSHELAHAITANALKGFTQKIEISTVATNALTFVVLPRGKFKRNMVHIAGPIGGVAFASLQLVAAAALRKVCLPMTILLGLGGLVNMADELLYAVSSSVDSDHGDFGSIRNNSGLKGLLVASTTLVSECALGIFAAWKLFKKS